jgi:hypothetical protein
MNKKLLEHLTQDHINNIKKWLKADDTKKRATCPFVNRLESFYSCDICMIMFKLPPIHFCPCDEFSVSHVTKVAKQTIEEWEVYHG